MRLKSSVVRGIALGAMVFHFGCNSSTGNDTAPAPEWVGTWEGDVQASINNLAVNGWGQAGFVNPNGFTIKGWQTKPQKPESDQALLEMKGTWIDIGKDSLELSFNNCTFGGSPFQCAPAKDTVEAKIENNQWTLTTELMSGTLTKSGK